MMKSEVYVGNAPIVWIHVLNTQNEQPYEDSLEKALPAARWPVSASCTVSLGPLVNQ